jgi:hypothetical protein
MLVYDPYFKIWILIIEPVVERQHHCETCEAYKSLGLTACEGCAG